MGGKYSVQNTKEALEFGFATWTAVDNAKADGKIDLADVGHLMIVFPTVGPMIKNFGDIPKELGELDEADSKELKDFAAAKLSLRSDDPRLIKKINAALNLVIAIGENWAVWKSADPSPDQVPDQQPAGAQPA